MSPVTSAMMWVTAASTPVAGTPQSVVGRLQVGNNDGGRGAVSAPVADSFP